MTLSLVSTFRPPYFLKPSELMPKPHRTKALCWGCTVLSGRTKFLKNGELLFRTGEEAEGMYVIKRGNIEIFLENKEAELSLAIMGPGSVLGELSLFDRKPRSASARAVEDVELSLVSVQDFAKVLQLVPKWFVSLTTSICSRLRETNNRLQQSQDRYLIRLNHLSTWIDIINVIDLLFYKLGEKQGPSVRMICFQAEADLEKILAYGLPRIKGCIAAAIEAHLLRTEQGADGETYIYLDHRNKLRRLTTYMRELEKESPDMVCDLDLLRHIMHEFLEGHKKGSTAHTPEEIAKEAHQAFSEISQASVNEASGANRRQHFRILYKGADKPTLDIDGHVVNVLDISEQAVRFEVHDFDEYQKDQVIGGIISFPQNRGMHTVEGKILRCTGKDAVLIFFPDAKIPANRIMTEQRILIQKGLL